MCSYDLAVHGRHGLHSGLEGAGEGGAEDDVELHLVRDGRGGCGLLDAGRGEPRVAPGPVGVGLLALGGNGEVVLTLGVADEVDDLGVPGVRRRRAVEGVAGVGVLGGDRRRCGRCGRSRREAVGARQHADDDATGDANRGRNVHPAASGRAGGAARFSAARVGSEASTDRWRPCGRRG